LREGRGRLEKACDGEGEACSGYLYRQREMGLQGY